MKSELPPSFSWVSRHVLLRLLEGAPGPDEVLEALRISGKLLRSRGLPLALGRELRAATLRLLSHQAETVADRCSMRLDRLDDALERARDERVRAGYVEPLSALVVVRLRDDLEALRWSMGLAWTVLDEAHDGLRDALLPTFSALGTALLAIDRDVAAPEVDEVDELCDAIRALRSAPFESHEVLAREVFAELESVAAGETAASAPWWLAGFISVESRLRFRAPAPYVGEAAGRVPGTALATLRFEGGHELTLYRDDEGVLCAMRTAGAAMDEKTGALRLQWVAEDRTRSATLTPSALGGFLECTPDESLLTSTVFALRQGSRFWIFLAEESDVVP